MALTRNAAKCLGCGTVIESTHRHDWVSCPCGALFVDGGLEYQRLGWTDGIAYEVLTEGTD